jgi:hypothetical protein
VKKYLFLLAIPAIVIIATWGPPPPTPNPPGSFSFAAFGDAPYYIWEEWQYRLVLRSISEHELAVAINIGDIFWRPCSDARYQRTLDEFNALRHPVIYTPGDNEWADCWERAPGGYAPLERLARLRRIFFSNPASSLGGRRIALTSQGGEFVENVRWEHEQIVFATIHVPGSWNGARARAGRTPADEAEVTRRTAAAVRWLREAFASAAAKQARAVVIAYHASLGLYHAPGHPYRRLYEPIVIALEEEAARWGKPVLVVHGDDHHFVVDRPFPRAPNITRLEVPGSPLVGWVRVIVRPETSPLFEFQPHVVPRWKYW